MHVESRFRPRPSSIVKSVLLFPLSIHRGHDTRGFCILPVVVFLALGPLDIFP